MGLSQMNDFCYFVLSSCLRVPLAPPLEVGRGWVWERAPSSGTSSERLRKASAPGVSGEERSDVTKSK